MTKQEFISGLRRGLAGMTDAEYVNDTVNYYENYIESEIRSGKSEEEVLEMLGNPSLIAKSVKASRGEASFAGTDYSSSRGGYEQEAQENMSGGERRKRTWLERFITMPGWAIKLTVVAVIAVVFIGIAVILHWLFPVIVIGFIAYVFYRFFVDNFLN